MKSLVVLVFAFLCATSAHAESMRTDTLNVSGNCGSCKKKIEAPFKDREGIQSASWDKKTKKFVVTYDSDKIKREQIEDAIVKQGYDTEGKKAQDEVYEALPKCCKYRSGPSDH
ncbi:MAG: heavy-metal-associated domain-containing protein [Candidatus Kapaibacterium sp.]